jgi:hypothetical protein
MLPLSRAFTYHLVFCVLAVGIAIQIYSDEALKFATVTVPELEATTLFAHTSVALSATGNVADLPRNRGYTADILALSILLPAGNAV